MRFPFYDKPWQITTIGNCCRSLDYGLGASAIDYDGKHKYIRITDIDEETNTFSNINITSPSYYDEEHKVKINDILFARTGASVGKTYCYNPKDGELYYAGFLIAAHVKNEFDPKFIFYNTVTTRYKNWVKIMSARSGQPGINADEYRSHTFYIPIKDEQLKISAFLSKLDERILLQNKIIEEKRLLKNLIIDKIFFKSNTDFVPLSSLINLKNGYAFKSDCYSNSDGYKVITIGNVSGDRYLDLKKFNCISILPIDIQEHQILKRGDLLISLTGNVGRVSICNESNCVLNQRVGLIEFFDEDDKEYIYQIMSSKRFQNDMISRAQGAAQLNIGKDDILNYRIPYLNDSIKRKKISSVLSILDNVILTDENLLYAYDKQKQFLLNNLFI